MMMMTNIYSRIYTQLRLIQFCQILKPLRLVQNTHVFFLSFSCGIRSKLQALMFFFCCLDHKRLVFLNLLSCCLIWFLFMSNLLFVLCYAVMAGSAPEGTQFDARQFDQKLNEVSVLSFSLSFHMSVITLVANLCLYG